MIMAVKNFKILKFQDIKEYEDYCDIDCINRASPEDMIPMEITANSLPLSELLEKNLGEPLLWSVLVSDKMKASKESSKEYSESRELLCRLHNHDALTGKDYKMLDTLIDEYRQTCQNILDEAMAH